jgi:hypothetical protein
MDAVTLQGKIYSGYAQAALRIGLPHDLYRPRSSTSPTPLDPVNKLTTLPAHFRVDDKFARPNVYGKPLWLAYVDGSQLQVGDYLSGSPGIKFVAAMQPLLPILCVECNRTITVTRPALTTQVGAISDYNGQSAADITLMAGWPCSILAGTKGDRNEVGLPGDVRTSYWAILLPAWPGLVLNNADAISDDSDRRYIISTAELTDLGWRLTAQQAVT